MIEREIRARYEDNISAQVQSLLLEQLPYGEPSQEKLARQLFMSLRTLQRRLQRDGASYAELLDDTRLHLARKYLAQEQLTLTEVSGLLGFKNQSSFIPICTVFL